MLVVGKLTVVKLHLHYVRINTYVKLKEHKHGLYII